MSQSSLSIDMFSMIEAQPVMTLVVKVVVQSRKKDKQSSSFPRVSFVSRLQSTSLVAKEMLTKK